MSAADFGAQGQVAAIKARGCAAAGVIAANGHFQTVPSGCRSR